MRQRTLSFSRAALAVAALVLLHGCAAMRTPATPVADAAAETPQQNVAPGDSTNMLRWSLNERDRTLKAALERWAYDAGWRLLWELGVDYRIDAAASIEGTFEEAVGAVMKNMEHADVPPKAIFYRGNGVLRVVARGTQ
jgi:hypothetical protein